MSWIKKIRDFFNPSTIPESVDVVIIGLGNPGQKYVNTRHNIGFIVADHFVNQLSNKKTLVTKNADYTFGSISSGKKIAVIKPLTFMNLSGEAVKSAVEMLNVTIKSTIVIVDDFNIPLGSIRTRKSGSSGGHNGLKSIEAHVGVDYPRLRFGIGPLPPGLSVIDFVLGEFTPEEQRMLPALIPTAIASLTTFINEGIEVVMSKFNK
jgi:PTH1 family peptidyl-tRNA hydrolase